MPENKRTKTRRDPNRNFNFIVAMGVSIVGIAAVAIAIEAIRRRAAPLEPPRRRYTD
jgi:hypothetical protein